ncbi:peptidoglycan-binding protein [Candidatus Albibeggiatoa sp. nov. NOAA]|uniref:peptidoglycan-binding protein n=1 Tax=Candidatus Albibeggiatoa sp. nov. NOAA TaxID=3162724 RepID=UPI0032F185CA|nr:peptidoglycan-binding protein [Thiotrichaceae bacterium]
MKTILRFLLLMTLCSLPLFPVYASDAPTLLLLNPNVERLPNYPERYIVLPNDTLYKVLEKFVADPLLASEMWGNNIPQIRIGDMVSMLELSSGSYALQIKRGRTVKLSPMTRIIQQQREIPTISTDVIQHFLTQPRILSLDELEEAGYIVANANGTLLATTDALVYARGLDEYDYQERYAIVRLGQQFTDPDTGEVLAQETVYLGVAKLEQMGDPATLRILSFTQGIYDGDLLVPLESDDQLTEDFQPRKPTYIEGETARIIAVVNGVSQIGQYQIVVLNKGLDDGLERGHVLVANKGGHLVKDPVTGELITLPSQIAGTLMVFKSFERVSYALVMKAQRAISLLDEVTIP